MEKKEVAWVALRPSNHDFPAWVVLGREVWAYCPTVERAIKLAFAFNGSEPAVVNVKNKD